MLHSARPMSTKTTAEARATRPTAARSKRRWPWLLLALLTLIVVVASAVVARGPSVPVTVVSRRNLEQHLVASGRVMAKARVDVSSLTTGIVTFVGPDEGARVKAGDLLVQLDDREAKGAVAQATAAVAHAKARAEQVGLVASVVASRAFETAKANRANAEVELSKTEQLVSSGALPPQKLDSAKLAVEVARAEEDATRAQQMAMSARGVESRAAWAALSQAEAELALANVKLSQTQIFAHTDAVVLSREVEPFTVVQPARVLFSLATLGETRLQVLPDERDLALIQIGQRARASADAYPDETFAAEVSYIAPSIEAQRGTVEVHLRVPEPPSYLRPDMTVSVDLTVATKDNALVIPFEAVRGLATSHPHVLIVSSGRVTERAIKLGIRGAGYLDVIGGLEEGDLVVIPDGQRLSPSQRVRPKEISPHDSSRPSGSVARGGA